MPNQYQVQEPSIDIVQCAFKFSVIEFPINILPLEKFFHNSVITDREQSRTSLAQQLK